MDEVARLDGVCSISRSALTNVPLVLPRSRSVSRPLSSVNSACCLEMLLCGSQTRSGDRDRLEMETATERTAGPRRRRPRRPGTIRKQAQACSSRPMTCSRSRRFTAIPHSSVAFCRQCWVEKVVFVRPVAPPAVRKVARMALSPWRQRPWQSLGGTVAAATKGVGFTPHRALRGKIHLAHDSACHSATMHFRGITGAIGMQCNGTSGNQNCAPSESKSPTRCTGRKPCRRRESGCAGCERRYA